MARRTKAYTVEELAERWALKQATIRKMCRDGRLQSPRKEAFKLPGQRLWRIPVAVVRYWESNARLID